MGRFEVTNHLLFRNKNKSASEATVLNGFGEEAKNCRGQDLRAQEQEQKSKKKGGLNNTTHLDRRTEISPISYQRKSGIHKWDRQNYGRENSHRPESEERVDLLLDRFLNCPSNRRVAPRVCGGSYDRDHSKRGVPDDDMGEWLSLAINTGELPKALVDCSFESKPTKNKLFSSFL
ncbi:hypothetical protein U1Q18_043897 [Sarracenia purpurea var. burkii]